MVKRSIALAFASVALLMAPMAASQTASDPVVIEDLDCTLALDGRADFYEGCTVVGLEDGGMVGVGFKLAPDESIIFAGPKVEPKAIKVMAVSVGSGFVPAVGACVTAPRVITCSVTIGGRTLTAQARGRN